ncbi:MAG: hypothetical protein NC412_15470, partial [Roseburia sp.]|nr:hypothetical protein [Roseburia sp.]MCM1280172.1 hypothetical protein [Robinsoniella sp.]
MTLEEWLNDQLDIREAARAEEIRQESMQEGIQEGMQKGMQEGVQKGMQEAKQEAVFELLEEYGVIPEHVRETVLAQKDLEVLKRWHKLAAKADSMEQFEKEMQELA